MDKATWYAYPDFTPPLNTVVLIRTLRHSEYTFSVVRYVEDDFGNGEFVHPVFADRFAKYYPNDFMVLDLWALPERR